MINRVPLYLDHATGAIKEIASPDTISSSIAPGSGSSGGGNASMYYSSTTPFTLSNSVVNTSLLSSPAASALPSSAQAPGNVIQLDLAGVMAWSNLAHTATFAIMLGGVALASSAILGSALKGLSAGQTCIVNFHLMLAPQTAVGTTATVKLYGWLEITTPNKTRYEIRYQESVTVDTTAANIFQIMLQWSNAAAGNTFIRDLATEQQINASSGAFALSTGNIDGGQANSVYGGSTPINCGGAV